MIPAPELLVLLRSEVLTHVILLVQSDFLRDNLYLNLAHFCLANHLTVEYILVLTKIQKMRWSLSCSIVWLSYVSCVQKTAVAEEHLICPLAPGAFDCAFGAFPEAIERARDQWDDGRRTQAVENAKGIASSPEMGDSENPQETRARTRTQSRESNQLLSTIYSPRRDAAKPKQFQAKLTYKQRCEQDYSHLLAIYWGLSQVLSCEEDRFTPAILDQVTGALQKIQKEFALDTQFVQKALERIARICVVVLGKSNAKSAQIVNSLAQITQQEDYQRLICPRDAEKENSELTVTARRYKEAFESSLAQLRQPAFPAKALAALRDQGLLTEELVQLCAKRLAEFTCDPQDHAQNLFFLAAIGRVESFRGALTFFSVFGVERLGVGQILDLYRMAEELLAAGLTAPALRREPFDPETPPSLPEACFAQVEFLILRTQAKGRNRGLDCGRGADSIYALKSRLIVELASSWSVAKLPEPQKQGVLDLIKRLRPEHAQQILSQAIQKRAAHMEEQYFSKTLRADGPALKSVRLGDSELPLSETVRRQLEAQNWAIVSFIEWVILLLETAEPDEPVADGDLRRLRRSLDRHFFVDLISESQLDSLRRLLERARDSSVLWRVKSFINLVSVQH